MSTKQYEIFLSDIDKIKVRMDDNFLNNLLFANIITLFEVYLQNTFVELLSNNKELMKRLTLSSKYKNNKISLSRALTNDMNIYLSEMIKNIVFHNLSDIEPLYKEVLGVNINYKKDEKVIKSIEKRHDIVHRNGYTKKSEKLDITATDILTTLEVFNTMIKDVDNQIVEKYLGIKI